MTEKTDARGKGKRKSEKEERTFSSVVIFLSLGAAEAVSRAEVRLFRGGARAEGGGGGAEAGGFDVVAEETERGGGTAEVEDGSEMRGGAGDMVGGLEAGKEAKKA